MLSVVIPYRNEDMLPFTLRRLALTCKVEYEVIIVDDGSSTYKHDYESLKKEFDYSTRKFKGLLQIENKVPIGNCYSRDKGIAAAKFDTILILDAHMNFFNDDWSCDIVEFAYHNPKDIACTISVQLRIGEMKLTWPQGAYYGAHIMMKGENSSGFRRILPSKWNRNQDQKKALLNGQGKQIIGSILGGAYIFRKSWYMNKLKRPWAFLRGWGSSEQTLSLVNYLMGGKSYILPVRIGHMYRTGGVAPYSTLIHNMIYNQLFLANIAIPDDIERLELISYIKDDINKHHARGFLRANSDWKVYREYIKQNQNRSWSDYKAQWMDPTKDY